MASARTEIGGCEDLEGAELGVSAPLPPAARSAFVVLYLGCSEIDRRYTSPQTVMPWAMAEVKKRTDGFREIRLEVLPFTLRGTALDVDEGAAALFEHRLHGLSRFAKSHQEPRCFAYLIRPQLSSDFRCHVFLAPEESLIPELFTSIRKATKEHREDSCDGVMLHDVGEAEEPAKAFCEVMYLGKIQVGNRKITSVDIDKLVEKLGLPEDESCQLVVDSMEQRQRHASDASVRSLPATLDTAVTVTENELKHQHQQMHGVKLNGTCSSGEEILEGVSPGSSFENIGLSVDFKVDILKDSMDMAEHNDQIKSRSNSISVVARDIINRTMLFRLGKYDMSLINLDQKRVMLERKFADISFVSQGHKKQEIFGFIARDPGNVLMCHLLRCHSDSVVEELMMSVRSAFTCAYEQNKLHLHQICTMCPLHQLQKLCQEINGLSAHVAVDLLHKRIQQLPEKDGADIYNRWKQENPQSHEELLEVLMIALRQLCEQKQREHQHISTGKTGGKSEFNIMDRRTRVSKLDSLRNKAKKSLTNSFESLIRGRKRDEARESFRQRSATTDSESSWTAQSFDSSAPTTPEMSPAPSPVTKDRKFNLPSPPNSPVALRPRSSTVGAIPDSSVVSSFRRQNPLEVDNMHWTSSLETGPQASATSPMKHMFLISGSNLAHLSPESTTSSICSSFDDQSPEEKASPIRRPSWRQAIFNQVVTPVTLSDTSHNYSYDDSTNYEVTYKRPVMDARARWRKAIQETLLLIRMNKENQNLRGYFVLYGSRSVVVFKARQDEIQKRQNLDYAVITPCLKEVTKVWEGMLCIPNRQSIMVDGQVLAEAVKQGVPKNKRGVIWLLLMEQHELKNQATNKANYPDISYEDLLRRLTTHQHAILIDLGRTFPKHPYFRTQLGPGQLALFNLLKAYSLLDSEVGYCQGLSFIVGVLLIHMDEVAAFRILKYLMFNMGLRNQYRPNMTALQIKLYQLTRLIHDNHRDLYDHFEEHEIVPTLYAAPWFLTLFASQFPLGFVSRVFDLIFFQGIDIVFKVAVILLGDHKELIMQCDSFETIVEFLKTTLPSMGIVQMERIINQVFEMDIAKQLQAYEVEYHVLQEELTHTPPRGEASLLHKMEQANKSLKEQNTELLEKLQNAHSLQHSMEITINNFQMNENRLRSKIQTLELERAALLARVTKLQEEAVAAAGLRHSTKNIPSQHQDNSLNYTT